MENAPFRYDIHNAEIARELLDYGFVLHNTSTGIWTLEAPTGVSTTKARKIISGYINLYVAAKDVGRAQRKYKNLLDKMDFLKID